MWKSLWHPVCPFDSSSHLTKPNLTESLFEIAHVGIRAKGGWMADLLQHAWMTSPVYILSTCQSLLMVGLYGGLELYDLLYI